MVENYKTANYTANSLSLPPRDSSKLFQELAIKIFIISVLAILVSSIDNILELSALPFKQLVIFYFFWIAGLGTASFGRNLSKTLLWALLINSCMQIYQLVIYSYIENDLVKIGPTLLSASILLLKSLSYKSSYSAYCFGWILINLPSLYGAASEQLVSAYDTTSYFILNVIFPLIFLRAVDSIEKEGDLKPYWPEIVALAILTASTIPILLTPLELSYRDTTSMAGLEYGRSYSVLGTIILTWPILVHTISEWKLPQRIVALCIIFSTALISFSRGVAFVGFVLLLGTILLSYRSRKKIFSGFIISISGLFIFASIFMYDWLSETFWYWLLRFNIVSNSSVGLSFDFAESVESGRNEIWEMGIRLFLEHPFCGSGLGSTSPSISRLTDGFYTYGGFHGLFLTVLVERGIFGLIGVITIFARILWLISTNKRSKDSNLFLLFAMSCFILFSNTTGVEMFLYSSRTINVDITLYLFLFLAYLESAKRKNYAKV